MQRDTCFQIKVYISDHDCLRWNYNSKTVNSTWIARKYVDKVKSNRNWKISEFRDTLSRELKLHVTSYQARRARNKAIALIDGDVKDSFGMRWNYCNEIVRANPGTSVFMNLTPNENPNKPMRFQRFYICFAACKEGFKAGCRKIVGVDGCWLKGTMYGAQLLTAVTLDGNNNIFLISYAIVEKENRETWEWFLSHLMNDIEIEEEHLWVFMSDKQKGLIEAFENVMPNVYHRFCVRHLHNNFKRAGFHGNALKFSLWKAANATTVEGFTAAMDELLKLDSQAYEWLSNKLPSEWSRSHFSTFPKCDILLKNHCEVFNKMILDARDKPILKLLEIIRHLLMARIDANREKASRWNLGEICPNSRKRLDKNMMDAAAYIPKKKSNMWNYEILGPSDSDNWVVDLYKRTCSCRRWDLVGIPCKHAISAIWMKKDEVLDYVDECYKVDTYRKIYEGSIFPMNGPDLWPKSLNPPPLPPSYLKNKKGRKQKLRRKEDDEPGASKTRLKRKQKSVDCSKCKRHGHNRRTCTSLEATEIDPSDYQSGSRNVGKLPVRRGPFQESDNN